jgi:putative hemolysin
MKNTHLQKGFLPIWVLLLVIIAAAAAIAATTVRHSNDKVSAPSTAATEDSRAADLPNPTSRAVNTVSYSCDSHKTILAEFQAGTPVPTPKPGEMPIPTGQVVLRLSDGRSLALPRTLSADGTRYANFDESMVFWGTGDNATLTENNKQTYSGCVVAGAANMPNPASVYCQSHGGRPDIRTASDGSQWGFCVFKDNTECDEWAFFRGNCNLGMAPNAVLADWKTYRNAKFGFGISYPANWKVTESSPGAIAISGTDGGLRFLAVETSKPYASAAEELAALARSFGAQSEQITLHGYQGIRRDDEGGGRTYYVAHGDMYVEIMTNKEQMEKNENIGKVVSTFNFTRAAVSASPSAAAPAQEELIGGQRDEHGCLTPAGYSWCAAKQKCLRTWEEPCG